MPVAVRTSSFAANIAALPVKHDNDRPLWMGPCGKGPLGGVTQSMLVRFMSCRDRFRLKYILGLELPDKWNKNIGYGNMWHACEEGLATGKPAVNGVEPWMHYLAEHTRPLYKRYPMQRDELDKWWSVACVQFPEYVKHWANHPDVVDREPMYQELVFDVEYQLRSRRTVRLRGKFDSVDRIGGGLYLQENKTKGDIDRVQIERQLKFDLQTMTYLVAMRSMFGSHSAMGVRYNVVRRPLSGGVGSITPHKAKSTKSKVTPAETADEFYERLRRDYIAADPDYWFFRVRAEVSDRDLEVFTDQCLDPLLENLCSWYEQVTDRTGWQSGTMVAPPLNYRTPFGVWSALEEGGATEYDHYLDTGTEVGLRRVHKLFPELEES
jgi:PD-(D/E)XK nuclease superfamily